LPIDRSPTRRHACGRTYVKIIADLETCQGYANCVVEAPDVFDIDESTGKVVVLEASPQPGMEADARRAVAACPVKALSVED